MGRLLHHPTLIKAQYASKEFIAFLEARGALCSLSRRGNCWDNTAMESFFSTLELECLYRQRFKTRAQINDL